MKIFLSILIVVGLLVFLVVQLKNLILAIIERKKQKNQNKNEKGDEN